MTVLSLTWESPYLGKTIFILKRGPAIPADYILEVVVIIQFPFTFMAVDGLVTQGAMASVAMIASLLTVPNLCMADASLGAQQHLKILRLICINLFFCLNFNILFTYTVPPRGHSSVVGGLKWWLSRGCKRPFHREAQIWVKQYLA